MWLALQPHSVCHNYSAHHFSANAAEDNISVKGGRGGCVHTQHYL